MATGSQLARRPDRVARACQTGQMGYAWAVGTVDEQGCITPALEGEEPAAAEAWARVISATETAVREAPATEYRVIVGETVATLRPGRDSEGAPDVEGCRDALTGLRTSVLA